MFDYTYTREIVDWKYNICNRYLVKKIKEELEKDTKINCNEANCVISFSVMLSDEEESLLDDIVLDSKVAVCGEDCEFNLICNS